MVPCFCACSESGSITGELLAEILKYIDKFDRSDGVSPFLLLDGHGSQFELPFLECINNEAHKWKVASAFLMVPPIGK
jgi:hypothetical protein